MEDNASDGGLSTKPGVTCHKCDRKFYIQRYFKYNGKGSDGHLSENLTRELPE